MWRNKLTLPKILLNWNKWKQIKQYWLTKDNDFHSSPPLVERFTNKTCYCIDYYKNSQQIPSSYESCCMYKLFKLELQTSLNHINKQRVLQVFLNWNKWNKVIKYCLTKQTWQSIYIPTTGKEAWTKLRHFLKML